MDWHRKNDVETGLRCAEAAVFALNALWGHYEEGPGQAAIGAAERAVEAAEEAAYAFARRALAEAAVRFDGVDQAAYGAAQAAVAALEAAYGPPED